MDRRRLGALAALGAVGLIVGVSLATDDAPVDTAEVGEPPSEPATGSPDPATPSVPADGVDATANPFTPPLPDRGGHPPLIGIDGWLQSDVTSLEQLRGKVVAVQFWTFGCSNCTATIPHLQDLHDAYAGVHFEIVGVHAPEFDRERDPAAVAEAAERLGVTWPIALDTEKRSFRSWQTERRFWPRLFLIDHDGHVRYDKIGEGRYDEIEAAVAVLVDEARRAGSEEFADRDVDENSDAM